MLANGTWLARAMNPHLGLRRMSPPWGAFERAGEEAARSDPVACSAVAGKMAVEGRVYRYEVRVYSKVN